MGVNEHEVRYWAVVEQVAQACALYPDPDRAFHRVMEGASLGRKQFRDTMDYGDHPSAFADWLGEPVEKFTPDDWESVTEHITYMALRADVLGRVADIKESK
jgi:hypothetical protein